jgi:hypothetical protein
VAAALIHKNLLVVPNAKAPANVKGSVSVNRVMLQRHALKKASARAKITAPQATTKSHKP